MNSDTWLEQTSRTGEQILDLSLSTALENVTFYTENLLLTFISPIPPSYTITSSESSVNGMETIAWQGSSGRSHGITMDSSSPASTWIVFDTLYKFQRWKIFPVHVIGTTGFELPNDEFAHEREAFLKLKGRLLSDAEYRGKFVAILNEKPVDSDTDRIKLVKRVYQKFGYRPVYIRKVEDDERVFEMSSPESVA